MSHRTKPPNRAPIASKLAVKEVPYVSLRYPSFFDFTIGAICGNRYSEFRFEWGLPLDRASHDLSNPGKITIIGDCTRRHALVKVLAKKLHAPPRAAVPTVSKTHPFRHRIEQLTPPSGSSSSDLKNGMKNSLTEAATRRWKCRQLLPRASTCQHASTRLALIWPATSAEPDQTQIGPNPNRTRPEPVAKKKKSEKCRKIQNFWENSGKLFSLLNFFNYKDLIVIS